MPEPRRTSYGVAVLAAMAFTATACAGSHSAGNTGTSTANPTFPSSSAPDTTAPAKPKGAAGAATPELALTRFLTDVINGDWMGACMMRGVPGPNSAPPQNSQRAYCTNMITSAASGRQFFADLAPYVTPANAGQATTSVFVSAISGFMPTDPHVVVPDTGVTVDGRPLHDIIQENSGNVPTACRFLLSRGGNRWYVVSYDKVQQTGSGTP